MFETVATVGVAGLFVRQPGEDVVLQLAFVLYGFQQRLAGWKLHQRRIAHQGAVQDVRAVRAVLGFDQIGAFDHIGFPIGPVIERQRSDHDFLAINDPGARAWLE